MSYELLNLSEIIEVKKGQYITKKDSVKGPYPVILGGREPAYYINRFNHTGKAIVVSRSGASAGYVSFWNEPIFVTDGFLIEPKESVNIDFLYYLMKSHESQFIGLQGGSAIPHVTPRTIGAVSVLLPSFEIQIKIANMLTAYDSLIENNQKQIKLLEEAAQRLYKEWFVDLRFPGYEKVKVVDGVPEGWTRKTIGDILSYDIGGGWGEEVIKENFEMPAFVIRGTDLYGLTHGDIITVPYRYHAESNLSSRELIDGDIIFEVSGGSKTEGVARSVLVRTSLLERYGQPVMCASFCKLIRLTDVNLAQYMYDTFRYLRVSGKTSEFDKKSASSIVNYRWKDFLSQQYILQPDNEILHEYNKNAENYYFQILNHSKMIETLRNARDRLLPKLMSGELEV